MQLTGHAGIFVQDVHHVAVCLAVMDDDRHSDLARKLKLASEPELLNVARDGVPVIVEPDLAERLHLRVSELLFKLLHDRLDVPFGVDVLGMDADRGVDSGVFFGERDRLGVRRRVCAVVDNIFHRSGKKGGKNFFPPSFDLSARVKAAVIVVRV